MAGRKNSRPKSAADKYLGDMINQVQSRAVILDRWQGNGDGLRRQAAEALAQVLASTDLNGNRKVESERKVAAR